VAGRGRSTLWRVAIRLRTLSEAECYARCYGYRPEDVKVVKVERRPRLETRVSGEEVRRGFERRLQGREPEAA
jgi:hypothetical protein